MIDQPATPDPVAEDLEPGLLANCPRCAYALRGLPAKHRCPECGLEVDRRWQIIPTSGDHLRTSRLRKYAVAIRWFVILYSGVFVLVSLGGAWIRGNPLPALAIFVAVGFVVWRRMPRRRFIALGPEGIHLYDSRGTYTHCSWKGLGYARLDLTTGYITITGKEGKIRLNPRDYFSDGAAGADRCVQAINHYPRLNSVSHLQAKTSRSSDSEHTN